MPSAAAKKKAERKKASAKGSRETAREGGAAKRQEERGDAPKLEGCLKPGVQLVLPRSLTARQRAVLHSVAEAAGLQHSSAGEGTERRLTLGPEAGCAEVAWRQVTVAEPESSDGEPPEGRIEDQQLADLLDTHLGLQASAFFSQHAAGPRSGSAADPARARRSPAQAQPHVLGRRRQDVAALEQVDVAAWVSKMDPLLELERAAELQQSQAALAQSSAESAQRQGIVLSNLSCQDAEAGLLGRAVLLLVSNRGGIPGSFPLPAHRFSLHDVVALRPSKAAPGAGAALGEGVVFRVQDSSISIALDEMPEEGLDQPLRLEKLANEVTYQRLKKTLQHLSNSDHLDPEALPGAALVDVLFGRRPPRFATSPPSWKPINRALEDSQRAAVSLALAAQDIALIHGPPGTGKTTAVVEVINQEVKRGSKVLVCAPSNVAVDNLVARLATKQAGARIVRLGHPARLLPEVLERSLEAVVMRSDNSRLADDCRREIKSLTRQLAKLGGRGHGQARRDVQRELRLLRKEARQRDERAIQEVLAAAQVVCCTLTGVWMRNMEGLAFDVCIIDEAAQALEVSAWGALLRAPRAVLAGDHLQLPPTVLSEEASKQGLGRTLFERLQDAHGGGVSEMLRVQYRMHRAIMSWSSDAMYGGRVQAHEEVAEHTLGGLVPLRDEESEAVLLLVDTAGCDMEEVEEEGGEGSRANPGEAEVVMGLARRLRSRGLRPKQIGIITPYRAQVALLRELRPEALQELEISTVDGFQGREKEAILISAVRSNARGEVGFLSDERRMNVAVTRARRHCALVCDTDTLSHDPFLKSLVSHFEEHGEVTSAAMVREESKGCGS